MSRWAWPLAVVAGVGVCVIVAGLWDGPRVSLQTELRFARETAAIASIHSVCTEQVQYSSQFGHFASSLAELGAADLIEPDLAKGEKKGYRFTLNSTPGGYEIAAVPVTFGVTGRRTFYSDQTMVIRVNEGPDPATANSKGLAPTSP